MSVACSSDVPLILLPGMGANASMFMHQLQRFPGAIVPPWPTPRPGDDLDSYCKAWAQQLDPGCPCIVGGASFGGFVALEMTRHLSTLGCILIGSVAAADQLPKRIRMFRSLAGVLRVVPVRAFQWLAGVAVSPARSVGAKTLASAMGQFSGSDCDLLRWSMQQSLAWSSSYEDANVAHIHGDRDWVLPIRHVNPDVTIHRGGHLISITHAKRVTAFLEDQVGRMTAAL